MATVALQPKLVLPIYRSIKLVKRLDFGGYTHVMLIVYDIIIIL